MIDFGYDISDFKAIHEEYGTMEDFEELISEANRLNIKIILDFVPNHSSDQCEWFIKSAAREEGYEDFYVWADGHINEDGEMEPPNNWVNTRQFYKYIWVILFLTWQFFSNQTSDARDYVFNIQKWLTYMPRNHVANWVMSNHDNPRIASRLGVDSVDAMNMLLMTLPGVAVTYNVSIYGKLVRKWF